MPKTIAASSRKPWVDLLRALAQIFVILGHIGIGDELELYTVAIKIPMFFAISGYVFRDKGEKDFYVNLIKHLVVPWLALSMVRYVAGSLSRGPGYLLQGCVDMVMGDVAWFMPCTILAQVIHHYLRRLCPNGICLAAVCGVCFALGLFLARLEILNVFMFQHALMAQLYLLVGYLFARWEDKSLFCGWKIPVLGFVGYLLLCTLCLFMFDDIAFNIRRNEYFNLPLSLLLIFLGCLSVMALGKWISKAPRFLCFVGQNTLIFYIWESYPRAIFKKGLSMVGLSLPDGILGKLILVAVTIAGCSLAALLMNRFLPRFVGKKPLKKKAIH